MTTYYKLAVNDCKIISRCVASSRRQALRRLGISQVNRHLFDAIPASRLPANAADPYFLIRAANPMKRLSREEERAAKLDFAKGRNPQFDSLQAEQFAGRCRVFYDDCDSFRIVCPGQFSELLPVSGEVNSRPLRFQVAEVLGDPNRIDRFLELGEFGMYLTMANSASYQYPLPCGDPLDDFETSLRWADWIISQAAVSLGC